jgi:hypothetical protein
MNSLKTHAASAKNSRSKSANGQAPFASLGKGHDMGNISPIGNRDTVADGLETFTAENQAWLVLLMESSGNDDLLLDGLHLYLDRASEARFLNTMKLEKCGEWVGNNAPARLQIRISEAARSSQHPAYAAFRAGLSRSGGLERAYPKAPV